MANKINPSEIPSHGIKKTIEKTKVELKNVLFGDRQSKDITVEVVPFDRYDEAHVAFAYSYSDMLFRAPSPFKSISDAAQAYVLLFMAHSEEDKANASSDINLVLGDLRACRTLFHQPDIAKALDDFFANA